MARRRAKGPVQPSDQDSEEGRDGRSRIPSGSVFYRRVLPMFLIAMGVLTLALILVAAGVLLGVVPWR